MSNPPSGLVHQLPNGRFDLLLRNSESWLVDVSSYAVVTALSFVLVGCSTTTKVDNEPAAEPPTAEEPASPEIPVVAVVPEEGCPEVEPDLTTVVGAKLEDSGLNISVRTTTWCNNHEFTVHTCESNEQATVFRVSETNDCGLPNDGVIEHVLFIERQHLGEAGRVETFDEERVTVAK